MNGPELKELFGRTLRSSHPTVDQFEQLAGALLEAYLSGAPLLCPHIQNQLKQIGKRTGQEFAAGQFDLDTARLVIADEIGYGDWAELVENSSSDTEAKPVLFRYAVAAMVRGDFTALEETLGGPEHFANQIIEWYEKGYFDDEPETLAEVFAAACMLGHPGAAEYLLDKGVDPLAGIGTGLNGFHYAASSGRLKVIELLIARNVPMETRNMYNGTVVEQALWSAVNEHTGSHAAIIEALIAAGAYVEPGTLEWWDEQDVPSAETKQRVAKALKRKQEESTQ
jgi:hypothetical protein